VIHFAQRVYKAVDDSVGFGDANWTVGALWWIGYSYRRSSPAACTPDDTVDTPPDLRQSDLSTASTTVTTKKKHRAIKERKPSHLAAGLWTTGDAQCMSPPRGRMKTSAWTRSVGSEGNTDPAQQRMVRL